MPFELKRRQRTFVDISLSFEPNPLTGDLTLLLNERAINNSLKNLVMIMPTEVPFNPDVGSMVRNYLFDVIDLGTSAVLTLEIERTIKFNEPRVELIEVDVDPQPEENHFMVNVTYKIVGYDQIYNFRTILEPTR